MCCLQIDFQNSDEGEVLKVLEQHAAKELQEDLLESEMQSGLSQVRLVRFADVQSMSSDLLLLAMYVSKAAYAAARKRIAALSNTSACVFVFLHFSHYLSAFLLLSFYFSLLMLNYCYFLLFSSLCVIHYVFIICHELDEHPLPAFQGCDEAHSSPSRRH